MPDIPSVERRIFEAAETHSLMLPFCDLGEIPADLWGLTDLQYLDLQGNGLSALPESLGSLTSLKTLDLDGNALSALPDSFANLTSLKVLHLDGNGLSVLPEWFGDLASLKDLYLEDNGLSVLPESFGNLASLKTLNLRANGLSVLPGSFGNLASLETLNLDGNVLSALTDSFRHLAALKALDLDGNVLSALPEWFGDLASLETLDLRSNGLTELPRSFANLTALKILNLQDNALSTLPDSLAGLTSLESLSLQRNRLSTLPEWFGGLASLRTLNLDGNRLSELPESLTDLTSLESLYLRANELSALPEWFGDLASLKNLDLDGNGLSMLPGSFGDLTALESLDLRHNGLERLTVSLAGLTHLEALYLQGNRLSTLPEWFAGLTRLETLYLKDNALSELPESLTDLASLESLHLQGNRLSTLPESFGNLTTLKTLDLDGTGLSVLPESFGKLTSLAYLYLRDNRLSVLPKSFGDLTSLTALTLQGNRLSVLPESFGGLTSLTTLDLDGNRLSELPESFGKLTSLDTLYLQDNQLTALPESFGNLTSLKALSLAQNPLTSPPPEVVAAGTEAVMAFMEGLLAGSVRQWASKVLLVGQGRAGKTSLLKALRGEEFDSQEESTHGLRVSPLRLPHPDPAHSGVDMDLAAWDFGGQEIYHATHQFFLSERSLFLLLWDAQVGWQESRLYYWLDMIKARAPQAPVVLVATHIGPRPPDFPLGELQRTFPHVIVESLEVDSATGQGIEQVREVVARIAADLPLMGTPWPRNWLEAADAIRACPDNHVSAERLHEIMADHGVSHPAHQEGLATALHSLGDILYYPQEDELGDLVVLRPQWLTGYLSRVLDDPDKAVYANNGVFTRHHQRRLWPDLEPGMRAHFLAMMERFDLSYRTGESGASLVVELLPWDPADYQDRWAAAASTHRELRLRYRLHTVPPGIPTWFIAREQRFATRLHWRTGVLLQHPDGVHTALLTMDQHTATVELAVRGPYPQEFFAVLKDGFQQTLDRYPGLGVDYLVPCPDQDMDGTPCPHEFRLELLKARISLEPPKETIECPVGMNDINVRKLLEGIEPPTPDDAEVFNETLATVVRQQRRILRDGRHQTTLLGELQEMAADQARLTTIQTAAIAEQQRAFLAAQRRDQNWHQVLCPTVMAFEHVRRTMGGSVVHLHLYCEAPGAWHRAPGAEPYEVKVTSEHVKAILPFATALLRILRYAVPVAGAAIGMAFEDLTEQYASDIEMTQAVAEGLADNLPEDGVDLDEVRSLARAVDDPQFRAMQHLLLELDPQQKWGGLSKIATPEGDVFWLCAAHARQYRGLPGQRPGDSS